MSLLQKLILSHILLTVGGVSIGNHIYCTLQVTIALLLIHALQFTTAHTEVFSAYRVFTSLLVMAFNGRHSPSSGFLNCSCASATSF
jgi:hypothetical protein